MKKLTRIIVLALVAVFVLAVACSCGGSENTNKTYFIGATGPLTGGASSYGISVNQGAQLAIDEINAAGGLNGVKFSYEMINDEHDASKVTSAYDTLKSKGMQASIGSVTSAPCLQFASLSLDDNLFFITPSSSAADVIEGDNAYRICFGDPDQGIIVADTLAEEYTKIGVIYNSDDAYSSGIYEAFAGQMGELNREFTATSFTESTKAVFTTQLQTLKAAGCEVIFLPIYYQEAFLIIKEAKSMNYEANFFGCDGLDGIVRYAGNEASILTGVKYFTPFDAASEDEVASAFVEAYEAKYGKTPDQFAADGYDAVMVIYEAMKKAGVNDVNISASALCDKITEVLNGDFTFKGATGTMTWDESGAPTKAPIIVTIG